MKKACFIISHRPDNRYMKRVTLLKSLFNIEIVFWNKEADLIKTDIEDAEVTQIHIKADQSRPLRRIPQTQKFSRKAYEHLKISKPDLIYAGNLDMLSIAVKYKHNIDPKTVIVYEVADLHRLIIDKQKGIKKAVSLYLRKMEKRCVRYVDILVLTSMKYYDVYFSDIIEKNKVVYIPNMPESATFAGYKPKNRDNEQFTVGFIGWIRYKDQLRMLVKAAGKANCKVLFAGTDTEGESFENYCSQFPYVSFLGTYDYESSIKDLYDMVDCVYAVYDADWANVRVALPNKLYETILCEKPIIVAKGTYLSEQVKEYGIGYAVSHNDPEELIVLLNELKNRPEHYLDCIQNCRNAKTIIDLNKYNKQLYRKVEQLL